MPNLVYNAFKQKNAQAIIDLDGSTMTVMLLKTTYTPDADHATIDDGTVNDPASHEISVAGYVRQALVNKTVGLDLANDFAYFDADDATFTSLASGQTIGYVLVFYNTGADNTSVPCFLHDVTDTPTNGSNITISWPTAANGAIGKVA